jgi:hypothetical protein
MRHKGDTTIRVVKRGGQPIGEIGTDAEASSGNGQYYVKLYDGSYDAVGYDTAEEALAELKAAIKQGVSEAAGMYGDKEVSWEKGGRRAPTGAFRNPAVVKTNKSIGTRVSDIGAGGKEYNVKTDKEWDKQSGMAEAEAKGPFAQVKTETLQQFWDSHKDEQNPAPVLADKLKRIRQELVRRKRADVTEDEVEEGWKSKLAAAGLAGAAALGGYAAGSSNTGTGFSNTKGIDQFNKPSVSQTAQVQPLRTRADLDAYNKTRPPGTSKLVNLPKDFEEDIAESVDPIEQLRADILRFSR